MEKKIVDKDFTKDMNGLLKSDSNSNVEVAYQCINKNLLEKI